MKKSLLGLFGVLFIAGCSTTSMKGTPFYTGEYEVREGPAADRVNVWPIVYYRDPALSVLWPFMEFAPDVLAVRPFYSIYERDTETPVYNVVWPIGKFDTQNNENRIFPVYWGDDYFNVLPLYWHKRDPLTGEGYNSLFPFWIYSNNDTGNSLHVFWPLYARYDRVEKLGWHLWPFYGTRDLLDGKYSWWLSGLGYSHQQDEISGHGLIPFYGYASSATATTLITLPYSKRISTVEGEKSWDLAVPLWYRSWEYNTFNWAAIPALSWGAKDPGSYNNNYLLGLVRSAESEDRRTHHVVPFYLYRNSSAGTKFYSLPYSRGLASHPFEKSWDLAVPLWYRGWEGDSFSWAVFPALAWGAKDPESYANQYLGGLVRSAASEEARSHHVLPFYYYGKTAGHQRVYSLPYSRNLASRPQEKSWDLAVPLWYRSWEGEVLNWTAIPALSWGVKQRDAYDNKYVGGLVRSAESEESRSHHVLPFYYYSRTGEASTFYSLPWWSKAGGDGLGWSASFPFYYGSRTADGSMVLTPLYAQKRHPDGSNAWKCFIPLVYFDHDKDAHFMTVLGGAWRMGDESRWLALPLLSGGRSTADSGRTVWLAGLAGKKWNEKGRSHYVFPLYSSSPEEGSFRSLAYAKWRTEDGATNSIIPLLLSGKSEGPVSGKKTWAAGLAGSRWNAEGRSHYVFPFYYVAPEKETFASLFYARWLSEDGATNNTIPLLLSSKRVTEEEEKVKVVGGLVSWQKEQDVLKKTSVFPLYWWKKDAYLYSVIYGRNAAFSYYLTPLAGRYTDEDSGSWIFPFYRHLKEENGDVYNSYLLLGKYENTENRKAHRFWPLFNYKWDRQYHWEKDDTPVAPYEETDCLSVESKRLSYLLLGKNETQRKYDTEYLLSSYRKEARYWPLFKRKEDQSYEEIAGASAPLRASRESNTLVLGWSRENWRYEEGDLSRHLKRGGLFPLWKRNVVELVQSGEMEKTSSYLGFLYDTRHEKVSVGEEHDYLRRRVLWRLLHYEKLNGDSSMDMFPGITIDSYKNGYYKSSFFWRLFRYEKDPEAGTKEIDFLFIPLKRSKLE